MIKRRNIFSSSFPSLDVIVFHLQKDEKSATGLSFWVVNKISSNKCYTFLRISLCLESIYMYFYTWQLIAHCTKNTNLIKLNIKVQIVYGIEISKQYIQQLKMVAIKLNNFQRIFLKFLEKYPKDYCFIILKYACNDQR